jgi:hypothetical protein
MGLPLPPLDSHTAGRTSQPGQMRYRLATAGIIGQHIKQGESNMTLGSASDWFLVAFAAATTVSAYRSWKTARELEWLMGALESHSTVRLRILAKDKGTQGRCLRPRPF